MKKYLIFDLDGTLIKSVDNVLEVILNQLRKYSDYDEDLVRYVFTQTWWKPLKAQIKLIFPNKSQEEIEKITMDIYDKLANLKSEFFSQAPELIKNLCKDYKLYLTTWNSTQFAKQHLEEAWIYQCFEKVLGSDRILKWPEHLQIFKELSGDKDFFEKTVYIWDGNSDREFAKMFGIDFVHIWNEGKDKYEISVVTELPEILLLLN